MDVMEALYGRRAIREYDTHPIPRGTLAELIAAATAAPSAMNRQPWAFAVIEGADRLDRHGADAKRHLLDTLVPGTPAADYRTTLQADSFHLFYHAPALIAVCATSNDDQSREDCCLAGQNLMLAAYAKGLGSCWIGFVRPWLNLPRVKAELGIPDTFSPVAPIIIGHPSAIPAATTRAAPQIVWCD